MSGLDDFLDLVRQLDEVEETDHGRYLKFSVDGATFGYVWEPTRTVGLKQTIAEQHALVSERPDVFEVQFTAYGFGWVVVSVQGVERDELAELTFEAWRLRRRSACLILGVTVSRSEDANPLWGGVVWASGRCRWSSLSWFSWMRT